MLHATVLRRTPLLVADPALALLQCADVDECAAQPCGPSTAGNCTDLGLRVYRCQCKTGYHYSATDGSCVQTVQADFCPDGDCANVVFDEADCPPMYDTASLAALNISVDELLWQMPRNCTGLTVVTLPPTIGVYRLPDEFVLDLQGSPGSFFVTLLDPPNATEASLTASGLELEIQFDSLTNRARMASNVLPCATILRAVHVPYEEAAMRALHPEGEQIEVSTYGNLLCAWQSAQILTVDLTSGTNALDMIRLRAPNTPNRLSILPRVLRQGENSRVIHNNVEIVAAYAAPKPHAVLLVPMVLPYCDNLVVDASASYGTGGTLTYEWSVTAGTPQRVRYDGLDASIEPYGTDPDQIEANARDMIDWLAGQSENDGLLNTATIRVPQTITIGDMPDAAKARYPSLSDTDALPGGLFRAGTDDAPGALNFSVTVTNVFGESDTAYAAVTRAMNSPPVVTLPSVGERVVTRGEVMYLDASVQLSSCFNRWSATTLHVQWRWAIYGEGTGLDAALDPISRNTSSLRLISDGLTPGNAYELVASAQMTSDPSLVGFASASVRVAYAGVQAILASVPSSVSTNQRLILDATQSIDLDVAPTVAVRPTAASSHRPLADAWLALLRLNAGSLRDT